MTIRGKRLRFEGRQVTKEQALAGLGNPRTWDEDAAAYALKIRRSYGSGASAIPPIAVARERRPRSKSQVSAAELELAAQMVPNMLPPASVTARYALARPVRSLKGGKKSVPKRKGAKKGPPIKKRQTLTARKRKK